MLVAAVGDEVVVDLLRDGNYGVCYVVIVFC
jgi:hypothetical protein